MADTKISAFPEAVAMADTDVFGGVVGGASNKIPLSVVKAEMDIPVKATGSEVDTGTDDAKFVTAKAIEDSDLVRTTNKISDLTACSSSELAGKVSDETGSGSLVFNTTPTTIALRETVVALTDGATPALDASLGTIFTLAAEGNRTIAVPSNAPGTGLTQTIIIRHTATGAARTLALNTGAGGFRFGSDITALTETASGKTDYIGCKWNKAAGFWDVVAYVKGY